jgi:transcriptional regulator with XRE-family HTH domain
MVTQENAGDSRNCLTVIVSELHDGNHMRFDHVSIKRQRLLLGLSQNDVAEKSGVLQVSISQIERGVNQSAKAIKKVAKVLKLRMEDLLVLEDEKPRRREREAIERRVS